MGDEQNKGNPAWKPILDVLPTELHSLVTPVLQEWDKGVQQKFAEIRGEYTELENYKKFVDANIDPEYVEQAVILADQLQRDPKKIVAQMNETWELGFVPKEEAEKLGKVSPEGDPDNLFEDADNDIFKDPRVKAMKEALDELQGNFQTQAQKEEEERAIKEFEEYLDDLEESYTDPEREGGPLPFNRTFVTALMSQGVDGEAAVKQYHEVLASSGVTGDSTPPADKSGEKPPAVMGSEGTAGSGSEDGTVDVTSLSDKEVSETVQQLLAKAAESGN